MPWKGGPLKPRTGVPFCSERPHLPVSSHLGFLSGKMPSRSGKAPWAPAAAEPPAGRAGSRLVTSAGDAPERAAESLPAPVRSFSDHAEGQVVLARRGATACLCSSASFGNPDDASPAFHPAALGAQAESLFRAMKERLVGRQTVETRTLLRKRRPREGGGGAAAAAAAAARSLCFAPLAQPPLNGEG